MATPAQITAAVDSFKASFGAFGPWGRPGLCPSLTSSRSILKSVTYLGSTCDPNDPPVYTLVYHWMWVERVSLVGAFTGYSFDVLTDLGTTSHPGTYTFSSIADSEFCNGQDPNVNPCGHLKEVDVIVTMNGADYGGMSTVNRMTSLGCGSSQTIDHNLSLSWPCSYYTGNPAVVRVDQAGSKIFVSTLCTGLCNPIPHVVCASSGSFTYTVQGSSPVTVSFNSTSGYLSPNLPLNTPITWSCTLSYSGTCTGTTPPKTGTITLL